MNVLIVDDNREVLVSLKKLLSTVPEVENIYTASNYSEAISIIKKNKPDLAIIDYFLRETTGIFIAKKLKSLNPLAKIAILSVSSSGGLLGEEDEAYISRWITKREDITPILDFVSGNN